MEPVIVHRVTLPTVEDLMLLQAIAWCGIGFISAILLSELVKWLKSLPEASTKNR
jgi:hypothetical protein